MCHPFKVSNKATKEAAAQEEERQRQILEAQKRIEAIFSSPEREQDIQGVVDATRGFLTTDLNRQKADTGRQLKFSLARSGLSGGSTDVDQNRVLAENYLRGILEVDRRASAAGATLKSSDMATKQGLFSQVLGGLDATTAAQMASQSLRQNIELGRADAMQTGLGNLFGGFSDIFKASKEAEGEKRAKLFDFDTLYNSRPYTSVPVSGSAYGG